MRHESAEGNFLKRKTTSRLNWLQGRTDHLHLMIKLGFSHWTLKALSCVPIHICREACLANASCEWEKEREGVVISRTAVFVSVAPGLWQNHRACSVRGLASLATLIADTFHATAINSSSGVYITNSWRTCAQLAGGGREACLLCKGSSLFLSFASFFISTSPHSPPAFISHMVPPGAIIWQHPPPPHATTSCHMTNMRTQP